MNDALRVDIAIFGEKVKSNILMAEFIHFLEQKLEYQAVGIISRMSSDYETLSLTLVKKA